MNSNNKILPDISIYDFFKNLSPNEMEIFANSGKTREEEDFYKTIEKYFNKIGKKSKFKKVYELKEIKKKILPFVSKMSEIKKIYLFGSYATNEATKYSDIDLLIEFDKNARKKTLAELEDIREKLEKLFNKDIDLIEYPIKNSIMLKDIKKVIIYEA